MAMPNAPNTGCPASKAQAEQLTDRVVRSVTKRRWKPLRDMVVGRLQG
jgi:hypothetical protein